MKRLLLSLWILGAVLFSANTLIILGWPTSKPKIEAGDAHKEMTQPKEALEAQNQPAGSGNSATATNDAPALRLEPNAGTSSALQTDSEQAAPSGGQTAQNPTESGNTSTPMLASPNAVSPSGPSAQQQAQAQQIVPQDQSPQDQAGEWVRVSRIGANVRSGPSSSASRLATLPPGQELRVVSREDGWVQVASPHGSETGWIYDRLLEPTITPDQQRPAAQGPAKPSGAGQEHEQGESVRVARPDTKVLAGPSDEAAMLFGFPEGRELRVLSREPGWVRIIDPGSKQVGWIAESSLAPASAEQQQAAAPQRPNRAASPGVAKNAKMDGAWSLGEEDIGPPDEVAEPQGCPRKWGRRGGRFAGALRRALGAF
ncbi:MAG: SH3 domain-containing protein [Methyloceanibacter sp.]